MWLRLYTWTVGSFLYLGMCLIMVCAPLLVPFALAGPESIAPAWKIVAATLLIGASIGLSLMVLGAFMWATFPRTWHSR